MGKNSKFCLICSQRPVNTCCCGCSLFCATITLAILQILGGCLNILVSAVQISQYQNLQYTSEGLSYYVSDANLDSIRQKYLAVYSLELVYGVILLMTGILGTMSQQAHPDGAKRFYYSYFLYVVVYETFLVIEIIIYGSMIPQIDNKGYYDKRVSALANMIGQIINFGITTLLNIYFLLVVWSNWQKKEEGHSDTNIHRVHGQQNASELIIIQQPVAIPMQYMSNQPYQQYQNYQPQGYQNYQPQVQMYQPQVQMMQNQPQIQEAVVFNNDYAQGGGVKNY